MTTPDEYYQTDTPPWVAFTGPWSALGQVEREAVLTLIAPRYLELSYPTAAEFAEAYEATLDSPEYWAKRAELLVFCAAALATSYADHDLVSALFIRTKRRDLVTVATLLQVRGTRNVPIGSSIGDDASSLPTHRMLCFQYPVGLPLDPVTTPESAVAEYSRLVVADADQLQPLLTNGDILADQRQYIVQHGVDDVLVQAHRFAQAAADPPRAYIFNQKPRLSRFFQRKGLWLLPLYRGGAEPTPKLLNAGKLSTSYFNRWWSELRAVTPPAIIDQGLANAVKYLSTEQPHLLKQIGISLPGLLMNDAMLAEAIERLAQQCQRPTRDDGQQLVAD